MGPPSASGAVSTASVASPPDPIPLASDSPPEVDRVEGLRAILGTHRAIDARESLSMAIVEAELGRLDEPFSESRDPTHLTASAIVVGRRGVVLHRHRRLHRWMQPGGHIEPGETPDRAAVRECLEETGLTVAHPPSGAVLVHVDVHNGAKDHVHLDLRYLVSALDRDPSPRPGESQDVAWFSWDEASAVTDEALAGALTSARRLTGLFEAGPAVLDEERRDG